MEFLKQLPERHFHTKAGINRDGRLREEKRVKAQLGKRKLRRSPGEIEPREFVQLAEQFSKHIVGRSSHVGYPRDWSFDADVRDHRRRLDRLGYFRKVTLALERIRRQRDLQARAPVINRRPIRLHSTSPQLTHRSVERCDLIKSFAKCGSENATGLRMLPAELGERLPWPTLDEHGILLRNQLRDRR